MTIRANGCGNSDSTCPVDCKLDISKSPDFGGCHKYALRAYQNWKKHREDIRLIKEMNRRF